MPIKCKRCENNKEFITKPNKYTIYKVIDNKLEYQKDEYTEEKLKLYCRECSEELTKIPVKNSTGA